MKRYFVLNKSTSLTQQIDPQKVDKFFSVLEQVTGLDRAIAEPILHGGTPIDHPEYRFTAKEVNPFKPAKWPGIG